MKTEPTLQKIEVAVESESGRKSKKYLREMKFSFRVDLCEFRLVRVKELSKEKAIKPATGYSKRSIENMLRDATEPGCLVGLVILLAEQ